MHLKQNLIASIAEVNKHYRKLFRSQVNPRIEKYVEILHDLSIRNVTYITDDTTFDTAQYLAALDYALAHSQNDQDTMNRYKRLDVLSCIAPIGPLLIECLTTHLAKLITAIPYPEARDIVIYLESLFPVTVNLNGKMRLHQLYDAVMKLDTTPHLDVPPTFEFTDYNHALTILQKPLALKLLLDSGNATDLLTNIYSKVVMDKSIGCWLLDDINESTLRGIKRIIELDTKKRLHVNVARIFGIEHLTDENWVSLYETVFTKSATALQRELVAKCIIVNCRMRNAYANSYNTN